MDDDNGYCDPGVCDDITPVDQAVLVFGIFAMMVVLVILFVPSFLLNNDSEQHKGGQDGEEQDQKNF